jgi:ribonucleotide reductase alpha subunit
VFAKEVSLDDTYIARTAGHDISVLIEIVDKNQLSFKTNSKETVSTRASITPRASTKPLLAQQLVKRESLH